MRRCTVKITHEGFTSANDNDAFRLTFDGYEIGILESGENFSIETTPGFHTVGVTSDYGNPNQQKIYIAERVPLTTYHLRVNPNNNLPYLDLEGNERQIDENTVVRYSAPYRAEPQPMQPPEEQLAREERDAASLGTLTFVFGLASAIFGATIIGAFPAFIAFVCGHLSEKRAGERTQIVNIGMGLAYIGIIIGGIAIAIRALDR